MGGGGSLTGIDPTPTTHKAGTVPVCYDSPALFKTVYNSSLTSVITVEPLSTDSVTRISVLSRGAMGRRIDPSWGGPIELFLVPASAPRLV